MTDFLTPREIAHRTNTARDAAVDVARDHGLTVTDATVLHDLFSVVVHLAPAPVVARIPVVQPSEADRYLGAASQRAELAVSQWLTDRGVPVIPPSSHFPLEPVRRDGFSMTFWQYVEEDRAKEPDYEKNSEATADLHAAMRDYPGRLSFLSAAEPQFIIGALTALQGRSDLIAPADLERARQQWQVLAPMTRSRSAFEEVFPGIELQPVHGDCPAANIFPGVRGDLYADFELVTLGPVEWDLAALGSELEFAYNRGARRNGMRTLDDAVMAFVNALGMLRVVATLSLVPQLPVLLDYLKPSLDRWRAMPFTVRTTS